LLGCRALTCRVRRYFGAGKITTNIADGGQIMSQAKTTTDHKVIRKWAEERGGRPARVKGTEDRDGEGILRFDFAEPDDKLEPVSWEEFFKTFDDRTLALLHQDKTDDGKTSRFFKFVRRDGNGGKR
jgi:hypothetical protein